MRQHTRPRHIAPSQDPAGALLRLLIWKSSAHFRSGAAKIDEVLAVVAAVIARICAGCKSETPPSQNNSGFGKLFWYSWTFGFIPSGVPRVE